MEPAHPREEQHGRHRGAVDECRAEVGLQEHEPHRDEAEPDGRQDGAELADAASALDQETGDREHEEQLSELGRLQLERAEIDPALRAAHRFGEDEDEEHDPDRGAVEEAPVALVDRGRDQDRHHHRDSAERDGDRLAGDEVVGIPRHVEPGDAADRPEPVPDERHDGEQEQVVEPADDQAEIEDAERRRPERCGAVSGVGDQSTFTRAWLPGAFWLKYFSKTRNAAGAAAEEPWPPFSITAQTTSWASSEGP